MKRRNFLKSIMTGALMAVGVKAMGSSEQPNGNYFDATGTTTIYDVSEDYLTDTGNWNLVNDSNTAWFLADDPRLQKMLKNGEDTRLKLAKKVFNERLD